VGSVSQSGDDGSIHHGFSVGSDGDNGASLLGVDGGRNGVLKILEDSDASQADNKEQGEGEDFNERCGRMI
jgi:hypothetical protein